MAYATVEDFTTFLDGEPAPPYAARLLTVAQQIVDDLLIGAVYDTDDDGNPTDPDVIAALRDATCAEAQYLAASGDETGAASNFGSMTAGAVSFSRFVGQTGRTIDANRIGPNVVSILRVAGLLPVHVIAAWW